MTRGGAAKLLVFLVGTSILFALGATAHAETIKVGIVRSMGCPGMPIALARGYFKDAGIDVELAISDSAEPIAVGVASGSLDFGTAGMSAAFYSLAAHGTLRVLASAAGEHSGGFRGLSYVASLKAYAGGLTSPKDFPGHTIAVTQFGTTLEYAIGLAGEKYGYPMSAVTVRALQSNGNVIAALSGNVIDAAVMAPAPALAQVAQGHIKLIGWVGDVSTNHTAFGTVFTSTDTANTRPDLVRRFLAAYRRGTRDFHNAFASQDDTLRFGPDAPAVLAILSDFTRVPPGELRQAITYVDADGRIALSDIAGQIAWYRSQGLMKDDVNAAQLIDRRYALPLPVQP